MVVPMGENEDRDDKVEPVSDRSEGNEPAEKLVKEGQKLYAMGTVTRATRLA